MTIFDVKKELCHRVKADNIIPNYRSQHMQ